MTEFGKAKHRSEAVAALLFLAFAVGTPAQTPHSGIVEKRNIPLAITTFVPAKVHEVKSHWRLAFFTLKITPFVAQSFDHATTTLGMQVKTATTWPSFSRARVVLTADGKVLGSFLQDWTIDTSWGGDTEQTIIEDSGDLVRKMAAAKEVYLTVLFPETAAPFDHMSFKLSLEQLGDCRLLADKYAESIR